MKKFDLETWFQDKGKKFTFVYYVLSHNVPNHLTGKDKMKNSLQSMFIFIEIFQG